MPPVNVTAGLLLITALVAYFAAGILFLRERDRAGLLAFAAGWLVNALAVLFNWTLCGHPPFGSMYHVLVVLPLGFLPGYLYLRLRQKRPDLGPSFAFASLVPLIGPLFMERDMFWRRMPALQSPWFVPHVLAYMTAYALATVAFIHSVRAWRMQRRNDAKAPEASLDVDAITRLVFPFMTFGLLSGALWAEEAWGRYWSWDSKETWALIMWLCYALYFHCRRVASLNRFAAACQAAGFAALIVTFLFVSLIPKLGSALHTYAQ